MANTVRIKRSTGSSAPTSLENAELAYSEGNNTLWYGTGTGGAGGSATSIEAVGGNGAFFDKTTTQTANYILAGPTTGSAAAAAYRALVAADIPSIAHTKISDFDAGVQAGSRLDQMAAPTAAVSLNSQKITSLATCTADSDAASKGYVDSVAEGLDVKDSVKATTTANISLSGTQTIDGISLSADDRVLVKNQSTQTENGLYLCKSGSWTRTDDLPAGADAASAFVFVEEGSTGSDTGWVCSSNKGSAVVGTNNLAFTQFSGAATFSAGDGLDKSGNTFSVDLKSNGGLAIESTELALKLDASSITGTLAVGDGGTGATSASAARTALGVAIGSDVLAYDSEIAAIAGLATTDGGVIVGNGSTFVLETGATARTSLGAQTLAADLTSLSSCQSGGAAALAALTSTEIEILDGATVSTSELNILDGVTSTASELNVLDGITSTTAELNLVDGGTSATSTTLASADRFLCNDAGTMKQVALSDLVTYLEDGSTSGFDVDGGTY